MSTRLLGLLLGCTLAAGTIVPVAARSGHASTGHIVAQRSARKGASQVYLPAGLKNGHRYRLVAVSSGHHKLYVAGFEVYTYLNSRHLFDGQKMLSLSGTTPYSFTITQPSSRRLTSWSLAVTVRVAGSKKLTVQVRDLGKAK